MIFSKWWSTQIEVRVEGGANKAEVGECCIPQQNAALIRRAVIICLLDHAHQY